MSIATLSSPLTLDPRQAVTLSVRVFKADCDSDEVQAVVVYKDSGGNVIFTDSIQLTGPQVVTWIANQEATILTRYLAQKGLTGTIV